MYLTIMNSQELERIDLSEPTMYKSLNSPGFAMRVSNRSAPRREGAPAARWRSPSWRSRASAGSAGSTRGAPQPRVWEKVQKIDVSPKGSCFLLAGGYYYPALPFRAASSWELELAAPGAGKCLQNAHTQESSQTLQNSQHTPQPVQTFPRHPTPCGRPQAPSQCAGRGMWELLARKCLAP